MRALVFPVDCFSIRFLFYEVGIVLFGCVSVRTNSSTQYTMLASNEALRNKIEPEANPVLRTNCTALSFQQRVFGTCCFKGNYVLREFEHDCEVSILPNTISLVETCFKICSD